MWILKGTCHDRGHDWKDGYIVGETAFVYSTELPRPYAPGQYPRVGNTSWSASTEHFTFERATVAEVISLLPRVFSDIRNNVRGRFARMSI